MTSWPYSSIKNWPLEDRPREKLVRQGEHALSDSELLAIIIRCGGRGISAVDLARMIMHRFKTLHDLSQAAPAAWKEFRGLGLGNTKIMQIKAAVEIGRRLVEKRAAAVRGAIGSPQDAWQLLMPRLSGLKKEVFKVILLDSRNRVITVSKATEGTVDRVNPILREIYQQALENFASSLICAHNHPSGDPAPSPEDKEFTAELAKAGKILSVKVLDHIIIGGKGYFSFSDAGLL